MRRSKMDKTVYLVGGSNGSGKTTFAKEFIKSIEITFLNADEIAKEFDPNDKEGGKLEAGRVFFNRLDNLIKKDTPFVIESTLSGLYLKKIIEKLHLKKYKVVLLYIYLDTPELAIDRVKIRVKEGGHNVPDDDIRRRYHRSKRNFWNVYKNLVDEWQIFYNGEDNAIQVACGVKEEFIIVNEEMYSIFKEGI
jgi:predicted ABC-type ATPase